MLGSVPEPHTWFRDISAVPAGHCMWIEDGRVMSTRCWDDIGEAWRADEGERPSVAEVQERAQDAIRESVARHLVC